MKIAFHLRVICKSILLYLTNTFVANIPFNSIRLFFYRRLYAIGANSSILMQVRILHVKGVIIGENSTVNYGTLIDSRGGSVIIGNNVNISNSVFIYTLEHDPQSPTFECSLGEVVIEDHAWIASRATILPGVRIGEGAVVACGAVVTKDVAAYTMVGGIPAKVIGQRTRDLRYKTNYFPWFM